MDEKKRAFRSLASLDAEARTRGRVPEFLRTRGFRHISEQRSAKSQIIVATAPSGESVRMRVRLCWHWGKHRGQHKSTYSGWQITKQVGADGWQGTLDRWCARNRQLGVSHVLLLQADDDTLHAAALIPLSELGGIWERQREVSASEIGAARTRGVRKNHAENGDSPTLWLKDDRSEGGRAVAAALWAWPGVRDLFAPFPEGPVIDDTYDDMPAVDGALFGQEDAPRHKTTRSEVKRDPQVRREVIRRSTDGCERSACTDRRVYPGFLDVHHIFGADKSDRVWTCVALCPNCHRDAHFSPERDAINAELVEYALRFAPTAAKAA